MLHPCPHVASERSPGLRRRPKRARCSRISDLLHVCFWIAQWVSLRLTWVDSGQTVELSQWQLSPYVRSRADGRLPASTSHSVACLNVREKGRVRRFGASDPATAALGGEQSVRFQVEVGWNRAFGLCVGDKMTTEGFSGWTLLVSPPPESAPLGTFLAIRGAF